MRLVADGRMGDAGIEPDIHDVHFFYEFPAAAGVAGEILRQKFLRLTQIPRIAALFFKHIRDGGDGLFIDDRLSAVFAVDDRNRHAPSSLTGAAPVGPVRDQLLDALAAPFRIIRPDRSL
jgi:hypothetical protein